MNKSTNVILLIIFCAIVVIDQITKILAKNILCDNISVDILSWLHFILSYNTGAAWSIFSGHSFLLATLGIVMILYCLALFKRLKNKPERISLPFICAGIFGNTIDRIYHGHVIDFISIDIWKYRWPTFNIADSAIFIGVIILLFTFDKKVQKDR